MNRPFVILIVLDGFGIRKDPEYNAISAAGKPTFDRLFRDFPWMTLEASGLAVGLPDGQMGNSEVGHLNMGAGRIVDQDIVRISKAVDHGELATNPLIVRTCAQLRETGGAIHFAGLLSDGGVHSLQDHLHGLIDAARANGVGLRDGRPSIFVHAFLDGRDTPPKSAEKFLGQLLSFLEERPEARLATVIGRYFAMDRDQRWDRLQRAYDLMTLGVGIQTQDALATLRRFYEQNVTDEFMEPMSVIDESGAHFGRVEDGDALLFFNFRADRMRQIVTLFKDQEFSGCARTVRPVATLLTMNQYHEGFGLPIVFPPQEVANHLGETLSKAGLRQLRIAETEKYAHVTFFFNGGSDNVSPGEERVLVPSPKVATYDLQPEMSVPELSRRVADEIRARQFDVIVLNIANPDMVGHTGVMEAAVRAVEATDLAVARILDAVEEVEGIALITADHGNCELMFDRRTNQPHTAHTVYPVPFILFDPRGRYRLRPGRGALENVSPTILQILGIEQPQEMTARSLLESTTPEGVA